VYASARQGTRSPGLLPPRGCGRASKATAAREDRPPGRPAPARPDRGALRHRARGPRGGAAGPRCRTPPPARGPGTPIGCRRRRRFPAAGARRGGVAPPPRACPLAAPRCQPPLPHGHPGFRGPGAFGYLGRSGRGGGVVPLRGATYRERRGRFVHTRRGAAVGGPPACPGARWGYASGWPVAVVVALLAAASARTRARTAVGSSAGSTSPGPPSKAGWTASSRASMASRSVHHQRSVEEKRVALNACACQGAARRSRPPPARGPRSPPHLRRYAWRPPGERGRGSR
jgi:hypothetical protein